MSFAAKLLRVARHELGHRVRVSRALGSTRGAVRDAVEALSRSGYYLREGFWDATTVDRWNERLGSFYLEAKRPSEHVRPGGIRWHHVEQDFPDLHRSYTQDPFIQAVVTAYQGESNFLKITYQYSYADARVWAAREDGPEIGLGRAWHSDNWMHGLKTILFLSDITSQTGPFTFVPRTHNLFFDAPSLHRLSVFWRTIPPDPFDSNALYFRSREMGKNTGRSEPVPIVGPRGTLVIVDTRGMHRAAVVREGERKVLWNYFS